MKTVYKISIAAIALLSLAFITAPAFAQFGLGAGLAGYGGACGGAVSYGPPQDCIAQVSCNVPVTTQVPTITTTCVQQEVPIVVPVQSTTSVTVPRVVVVPETCEVPYVTCAQSSTTVPVTVPVQTSVPVTTLVPQTYTMPMGCAGGAAAAPSMSTCGPAAGAAYGGMSGAAAPMTSSFQGSAQAMPQAGASGTAMPAAA